MGMAVGMPEVKDLPAAVDLAKNPLAETHEFKQACSMCYVKTGEWFLYRLLELGLDEMVFICFTCLCGLAFKRTKISDHKQVALRRTCILS